MRVRVEEERGKGVGGRMWARSKSKKGSIPCLRFQGNTIRNDDSVSLSLLFKVRPAHKLIGCRCIVDIYPRPFLRELTQTD